MRYLVIAALAAVAAFPRTVEANSGCSQAAVQAAQKALDAVEGSYGVGQASMVDMLTAKSNLLDAKHCAARPSDDLRYAYYAAKAPIVRDILAIQRELYENGMLDRASLEEAKTQAAALGAMCVLRQKQGEAVARSGYLSLSALQRLTAACADLKALQ